MSFLYLETDPYYVEKGAFVNFGVAAGRFSKETSRGSRKDTLSRKNASASRLARKRPGNGCVTSRLSIVRCKHRADACKNAMQSVDCVLVISARLQARTPIPGLAS